MKHLVTVSVIRHAPHPHMPWVEDQRDQIDSSTSAPVSPPPPRAVLGDVGGTLFSCFHQFFRLCSMHACIIPLLSITSCMNFMHTSTCSRSSVVLENCHNDNPAEENGPAPAVCGVGSLLCVKFDSVSETEWDGLHGYPGAACAIPCAPAWLAGSPSPAYCIV